MEISNNNTNNDFKTILNFFNKEETKIKALNFRQKNRGGRISGTIVTPRRGNFYRTIYRFIDLKRIIMPKQKALFLRTIYDPNRTAALGLICYPIGIISYILKPMKLNEGEFISNMNSQNLFYGDSTGLMNFSSGVLLYNIDGKFIRSAGCSAILVRKDAEQALLKLKSGELRYFNHETLALLVL